MKSKLIELLNHEPLNVEAVHRLIDERPTDEEMMARLEDSLDRLVEVLLRLARALEEGGRVTSASNHKRAF